MGCGADELPQCGVNVSETIEAYYANCSTSRFCKRFESVPYVYLAFSLLSGASCLLVFTTYALLPRLRHGGYSSRVFIYRCVVAAGACRRTVYPVVLPGGGFYLGVDLRHAVVRY